MGLIFEQDPQFEFELMRTMGQTVYGGAEIGECLTTAKRVTDGDYDSWHREWYATADWVYSIAETALDGAHQVSARDALLRASNYFRTSEFFLHGSPTDARIRQASDASVRAFHRATALCEPLIECIDIPYEDTKLPGYFYHSQYPGRQPTVLVHNGFDGTAEEVYSFVGRAGQERGYNVLVFEGPGQGRVIREQGLPFRPDWEKVVTPVLDAVQDRPEVRPDRLGLIGISLGGVLAPRAAAFDDRIAAVVAFDGVYDVGAAPLDAVFQTPDAERAHMLARLRAPGEDPDLDLLIERRIAASGSVRWLTEHGKWVMAAGSARDLYARFADYTVAGGIAEAISCPVLVMKAANDFAFPGQPEQLYAALTAPATFIEFTGERGGELHNQVDILRRAAASIYDWLDDVFSA